MLDWYAARTVYMNVNGKHLGKEKIKGAIVKNNVYLKPQVRSDQHQTSSHNIHK